VGSLAPMPPKKKKKRKKKKKKKKKVSWVFLRAIDVGSGGRKAKKEGTHLDARDTQV